MDLLALTVLLCRKSCGKLDRLSDRNKRGEFYGGLVNQKTDTRGRKREIEFRDSADEFIGTVRATKVAQNERTPRLLFLVGGRKPS